MCIGFFIGILYEKYMYIIKKNKYCLILALFILSFYLGRGVCALAKNTGKNTNSTVIVIDPGHGGSDPGKISTSGVMEKDVNLSIAMALKQLLKQRLYCCHDQNHRL